MTKQEFAPDLNAPRFRPVRKSILTKEFYSKFKKKYPQYKDVPNKTLSLIITKFNESLWENAIENRDGVELPEDLGYIFIGTCKPLKKNNFDQAASIRYNKKIKHRNFESDNYVAKIFYTNFSNKYRLADREIWQFKAARNFTRAVAKEYPTSWKKYVQVENYMLISKLFKKTAYKDYMNNQTDVFTENYNEFDID